MHAPTFNKWASEEEEPESDTPYIDMWRNARVWVDFFHGLH